MLPDTKHPTIPALGFASAALTAALWLSACAAEPQSQARIIAPGEPPTGFARADGPMELIFPADHGPHPDYQTEWWYYTGNLETAEGQHFGYQLTFFRRALIPAMERAEREATWAADQIYFAHFAITDVQDRTHREFERFSRGAAGLAGAQASPYHAWLEDWDVQEIEPGVYHLRAEDEGRSLDLTLLDRKGPILNGDRGYSQKGPDPGNASYYYSLTRLEASGTVSIDERAYQVEGSGWMDHEFSTSALAANQVGWDWFALQLDDGSELMVFQLRRDDDSVDPFSSGTLIAPDGSTRPLSRNDFTITVQDTWRSSRSDGTYPVRWAISVPSANLALGVEPYVVDQELNVSFDYWEGAVRIAGQREGRDIAGWGYVELTGYAGSMTGQF